VANKVEIANFALSNIRAKEIQSFTEASIEAEAIANRYDQARLYVLRAFPWNFANKYEALAPSSETVIKYTQVYAYPNDCLQIKGLVPNFLLGTDRTAYLRYYYDHPLDRRIEDINAQFLPYEVAVVNDVKVILTDVAEAHVQYTSDVEDTNLFDDMFIELLTWWLTALIAVPVVGVEKGREMRRDALQMYTSVSAEAKQQNANERLNPEIAKSDLTLVREY